MVLMAHKISESIAFVHKEGASKHRCQLKHCQVTFYVNNFTFIRRFLIYRPFQLASSPSRGQVNRLGRSGQELDQSRSNFFGIAESKIMACSFNNICFCLGHQTLQNNSVLGIDNGVFCSLLRTMGYHSCTCAFSLTSEISPR